MYLNTRLKQYLLSSFFQATTNIYWINELPFTLIFQSGPNHRKVNSDRLNQILQNIFKKVIICKTCRISDYACYGSGFEQSLLRFAIFHNNCQQRSCLMIPVRPVITVPETFFFSIFSCVFPALTMLSPCTHSALTVCSPCLHLRFPLRSVRANR